MRFTEHIEGASETGPTKTKRRRERNDMSKTTWTHKVRKESRGIDGRMHQMPTAITAQLRTVEYNMVK